MHCQQRISHLTAPPLSDCDTETSKFYGPTIHSLPTQLCSIVDKYYDALTFEFTGPTPYLFPLQSDFGRGVSSQQWTAMVKLAFAKFTNPSVSPPPKLLRQSCVHPPSCPFICRCPLADDRLRSCASHHAHEK